MEAMEVDMEAEATRQNILCTNQEVVDMEAVTSAVDMEAATSAVMAEISEAIRQADMKISAVVMEVEISEVTQEVVEETTAADTAAVTSEVIQAVETLADMAVGISEVDMAAVTSEVTEVHQAAMAEISEDQEVDMTSGVRPDGKAKDRLDGKRLLDHMGPIHTRESTATALVSHQGTEVDMEAAAVAAGTAVILIELPQQLFKLE